MTTVQHAHLLVPITQVELSIIERLTKGLGRMVTSVGPYRGELDKIEALVGRLPAAWVSFAGAKFEPHGREWRWVSEYVVMVGGKNPRSETTARHGGPAVGEVGVNMLVWACTRLLANQTLGLKISAIKPVRIDTIFNTGTGNGDMAVYGIHISTSWHECMLDDGQWPDAATDDSSQLFAQYLAQLDATPNLEAINLTYPDQPITVSDTVTVTQGNP